MENILLFAACTLFIHVTATCFAAEQNIFPAKGDKVPFKVKLDMLYVWSSLAPSSENLSSLPTYNLKPRLTQDPLKCLLEEILEYAFAENHACPLRVRNDVCHRKLNSLTSLL